MRSSQVVTWIFGRGCSVACGLTWTVPCWYNCLIRQWRVTLIKRSLRKHMVKIPFGKGAYRQLLDLLKEKICDNFCHKFVTTNWDYLLQREINNLQLTVKPRWLLNSHVYHLNGSVENWGKVSYRSEILLETDLSCRRNWSLEANKVYSDMIWQRLIIVAGVSFRCKMDQGFLDALKNVQDGLPIGEAKWIVVNKDNDELNAIKKLLKSKFPQCQVTLVKDEFDQWVANGCLELKGENVIQ